jgi:hypothetical protein
MLNVPPPTRVAIGTVEIAGKKYEVFASIEWARYFQQLNTQTLANASALGAAQPHTALLNDVMDAPDVFPGPPGPPGAAGDPGLALFLLQDSVDDQVMLVPQALDLSAPPPIGNRTAASGSFTTLTASSGFGCNGKSAQSAVTVNAASTDLASVIALCNQLRAALIANGIAA